MLKEPHIRITRSKLSQIAPCHHLALQGCNYIAMCNAMHTVCVTTMAVTLYPSYST